MNKSEIIEIFNINNQEQVSKTIIEIANFVTDEEFETTEVLCDYDCFEEWDRVTKKDRQVVFTKEGISMTEILEASEGGVEGGGEYACKVYKITVDDSEFYFKIEGYYHSYDGTTWNDCFDLVKPIQRMVTFYE